jgi:transposase
LVPSEKKVSHGIMLKALLMNAMGFSQQALYLTPQFMERICLKHLLGEGYKASDFNDDSIGRSLDALHSYGLTKLFVQLSYKACKEMGIDSDFVHVDSTNFSLEGAYEGSDSEDSVKICHGFSKSKRFDLKQVTLGLITTYQCAIPRYMQSFDGNASDKESLSSMIKNYISCFKEGENVGIFICDSGVYSAENIKEELKMADWITRVPETIKEARELVKNTKEVDFKEVTGLNGYRYYATKSQYGGVEQRWLVLSSEPLASAVRKTYLSKAEKEKAAVRAKIEKKMEHCFKETASLETFIADLSQKYPLVKISYTAKEVPYYCKPGKPKPENLRMAKQLTSFEIEDNRPVIEQIIQHKSRFILATNVLDTNTLSDEKMIEAYKSQATSVENGFKFLKDPIFFAESFFVKKPQRLEALLMIMALSLLVYSLCERQLQTQLKKHNETILNQDKRETKKPTMRLVFNLFRGIHLVYIPDKEIAFCANLNDNHKKIIRLLGNNIAKYYFLRE